MTASTTSPQHHQQWPTMNRSTTGMTNLNHQQASQMNLMPPQQQLPNVSQTINEMIPNRVSPFGSNTKQMNQMMGSLSQTDTSSLSQLDHMQHMQSNISNSINPINNPSNLHQTSDLNSTPISTSSVISASSNLLDPFSSVVDPIPPVIVTPVSVSNANLLLDPTLQQQTQSIENTLNQVSQEPMMQQHSHMQSNVHSDSLQTDTRSSMMDKTIPMSNNLNDNSNSQMLLAPIVSQQMPIMHEQEHKDTSMQDQNDVQLPRISDAFESPLIPSVNDTIKSLDADISNDQNDGLIHKSDDSRSQEGVPTNFDIAKQQSMSNDSTSQNESCVNNNGMNESISQNDNALQQAPETDKQMNDGTFSNNSNQTMENVIGGDAQSLSFDQSSNHSQYSMPLNQNVPQTAIVGETQNMYATPNPYDPIMTNVVTQMQPMMQNYPPPMSHHAEKSMLQQQLSELYCIPQTQEIHEKIKRIDDRLKLLQQHETNEQCIGGPQCVLLNPMMTAPMIESPQVSSTTGRGRGRSSSAKPRKPRQKKADKQQQSPSDGNVDSGDIIPTIKSTDQLPVSEDCVTQGAGLAPDDMIGELNDTNEGEDGSQDDGNELDTSTTADGKKPKKSRKSGKIKDPSRSKESKERSRKREPKDPNEPKKKSRSKRNDKNVVAAEAANDSVSNANTDTSELNQTLNETNAGDDSTTIKDETTLNEEVTDFDDIPVSKIPIKILLEEAAKKESTENENSLSAQSDIETSTPKRNRRSSGGNRSANRNRKRGNGSGRSSGKKPARSRARVIVESDGEGEDLGKIFSFLFMFSFQMFKRFSKRRRIYWIQSMHFVLIAKKIIGNQNFVS